MGTLIGEVVKEAILTLSTQAVDLVVEVVLLQGLFQVFTKEQRDGMDIGEALATPVTMVLQEHLFVTQDLMDLIIGIVLEEQVLLDGEQVVDGTKITELEVVKVEQDYLELVEEVIL